MTFKLNGSIFHLVLSDNRNVEAISLFISRLIQDMRFDQRTTKFAEVVDFTVDMFESQHMSNNAKLLIILSDGMGIFSIGTEKVTRAVRRAKLANIFTVFIILDNPTNKVIILSYSKNTTRY